MSDTRSSTCDHHYQVFEVQLGRHGGSSQLSVQLDQGAKAVLDTIAMRNSKVYDVLSSRTAVLWTLWTMFPVSHRLERTLS